MDKVEEGNTGEFKRHRWTGFGKGGKQNAYLNCTLRITLETDVRERQCLATTYYRGINNGQEHWKSAAVEETCSVRDGRVS